MKIPVTFRVEKKPDENGRTEVTAVFPSRETHPTNSVANRMCYAHIGQHSECSMHWMREATRPATAAEYDSLLRELRQVYEGEGDTLDVQEVAE